MKRASVLLILVAGCGFSGPNAGVNPDGDPPGDSGTDTDGSMACTPWTPIARHVTPCDFVRKPAWTVAAPGGTFNTTTGMYSAGGGPEGTVVTQPDGFMLRVVSVESFTVQPNATLRVIGDHPLLVLSWSMIRVSGTIDVSSVRTGATVEKGAGADRAGCQVAQAGTGSQDCDGGGGGGLRVGGGAGGDGGDGGGTGRTGAASIARPAVVAGGCPGARGGSGISAGVGGAGGGAIQLTARGQIEIMQMGGINAGGAGGQGGQDDGGGGGGGSGGFIGLDAPVVSVASGAVLAANGGGGGTGCDGKGNNDAVGPSGDNGGLDTTRADGGVADTCQVPSAGGAGGALGSGDAMELAGGNGSSSAESGGGGGGGVGFILVWSPQLSFQGTSSPAHERVQP